MSKKRNCEISMLKHTKLDYDECYAKFILETLYPNRYTNLIIKDKPDLRCLENNCGIEVTNAIPKEKLEALNLWARMKKISYKDQKKPKERMKKLGYEYQGGIQSWGCMEFEETDSIESEQFTILIDRFKRKVEKINSGEYDKLEFYDLFINSEMTIYEIQYENLLKALLNENKGYRYVYLTTTGDFLEFDLSNKTRNTITMGNLEKHQASCAEKAWQMVKEGENND